MTIGEVSIAVDTPHEIFVNKLCALLSRSELRDLSDVQVLLDHGLDLNSALRDAPQKDAGFSPLTLAWVLQSFHPTALAPAAGFSKEEAEGLESFRNELVQRLLSSSAP
ncbi:MAG TPA: nucleotidyl transferase AbiEii/AbiGii toxin family protein [Thermoanaerobaculia bacterium]|nr:nucleotidyl transferase AbiEii/AbiGii toxin family protein [Thermoanaerobaculia bacterium]